MVIIYVGFVVIKYYHLVEQCSKECDHELKLDGLTEDLETLLKENNI